MTDGSGDAAPPPIETVLTVLLAEYNTLRQESLESATNRIQITQLALTVLIAALATFSVPHYVAIPIFLVFTPAIAKANLMIWTAE